VAGNLARAIWQGEARRQSSLYGEVCARPETNIRTWGQLGLTGDWANKEIQNLWLYRSRLHDLFWAQACSTGQTNGIPTTKSMLKPKRRRRCRWSAVASERMLEELSRDKYGIGWGAQLHIKDYPNVKQIALAFDEKGPYVPMTAETVANRTYPLVRSAYVYVNRVPGRPMDPKVREFLRFVLSREGQQIVADTDMYYALTAAELREQLKRLE